MRWFWEMAIEPLLEAVEARTIVQVGVGKGHTTAKLVPYAEDHDGIVHGIDAAPLAAAVGIRGADGSWLLPPDWRSATHFLERTDRKRGSPQDLAHGHDRLVLHLEPSLTALPRMDDVDAVLIDGDHNWYTVINELRLLSRMSEEQGREFPLTLLHGIDWPFGRRDHYHDPGRIPEEYLQPLAQGGLWPGSENVFQDRGINTGHYIAAHEGGPRNGVRTAVEDFLAESGEAMEFRSLAGFQGLGILFSSTRLAANERLRACLETFESGAWLTAHSRLLEQQRLLTQARFVTQRQRDEPVRPPAARPVERSRVLSAESYGATPELTVVIPTLDVLSERVRDCVAAVRSHTDVDYEIVLVDNSTPPQGFTAPVNSGIRAARGAYVVVMNDDVEVLAGWWPPLREALDQGAYASFPTTQRGFHLPNFTGWCFAVSRETIARIGHSPAEFFDPQFRIHGQDTDLLLRLCQAGHPPVAVSSSRINHHLSQTVGSRAERELGTWVERQTREDRKALERKWPGGWDGPLAREFLSSLTQSNEPR